MPNKDRCHDAHFFAYRAPRLTVSGEVPRAEHLLWRTGVAYTLPEEQKRSAEVCGAGGRCVDVARHLPVPRP